jgi:hypothetical protein
MHSEVRFRLVHKHTACGRHRHSMRLIDVLRGRKAASQARGDLDSGDHQRLVRTHNNGDSDDCEEL